MNDSLSPQEYNPEEFLHDTAQEIGRTLPLITRTDMDRLQATIRPVQDAWSTGDNIAAASGLRTLQQLLNATKNYGITPWIDAGIANNAGTMKGIGGMEEDLDAVMEGILKDPNIQPFWAGKNFNFIVGAAPYALSQRRPSALRNIADFCRRHMDKVMASSKMETFATSSFWQAGALEEAAATAAEEYATLQTDESVQEYIAHRRTAVAALLHDVKHINPFLENYDTKQLYMREMLDYRQQTRQFVLTERGKEMAAEL